MSGPDIKVNAKVDNQIQITPHYFDEYAIEVRDTDKKEIIYESFVSNYYNPFLFRQF